MCVWMYACVYVCMYVYLYARILYGCVFVSLKSADSAAQHLA